MRLKSAVHLIRDELMTWWRHPVVRLVLIVLFLECLLFQWPSFVSIPDNGPTTVSFASQQLTGFTRSDLQPQLLTADGSREHVVNVTLSGQKLRSIYLDAYSNIPGPLSYQVFVTGQASTVPYFIAEGQVVSGVTRSRTLLLWPSAGVKAIRIVFILKSGNQLHLNRLILNRPIPFQLNYSRILILLLLGFFGRALFTSPLFLRRAGVQDTHQRLIMITLGFAIFLYCLWLTAASSVAPFFDISRTTGDLYNKDLTDALLNGRFELLLWPPVDLSFLANPYDPAQRTVFSPESILWDAAYFNGHYYVPYGIVPALLVFVPFTFISGYYFQTAWAVFLFGVLGLYFLVRTVRRLLYVFFPDLSFRYHFLLCLVVPAISFVGWGLARPKFYELALLSGFCFVMLGSDLLTQVVYGRIDRPVRTLISEAVLSTLLNDETHGAVEAVSVSGDTLTATGQPNPSGSRISGGRLFLACLCFSLAVGCRPNLVILFIPLVFVLVFLYKRSRSTNQTLEVVFFSIVPILTVGILLAYYNQARFGNIFEFGTRYQLTVTDQLSRRLWAPERIIPGIGQYLLTPPVINTVFPFIHFPIGRVFSHSTFFYTDGRIVGLLTLPFLSILLVWPLLHRVAKSISRPLRFLVSGCLLTGLGLLFYDSMAEGGLERNAIDFAVWLAIPAMFLWLLLLDGAKTESTKKRFFILFLTVAAITFIICLMLFLQGENDRIEYQVPYLYELLRRTFAFWLP